MLNLLLNIITMSNLIFLIHVRLSIHVHPLLRRSSVLPLPACRQRRRGGRGPRPSLLPHRAWRQARGARDTPPRRGKREAARWWTESLARATRGRGELVRVMRRRELHPVGRNAATTSAAMAGGGTVKAARRCSGGRRRLEARLLAW
jgi:hypothetical protein